MNRRSMLRRAASPSTAAAARVARSSARPLPGDTIRTGNPELGPLQDDGGPTQPHLPLPDSPAFDRGDAHGFDTDQRGQPRVAGAAADIGSVEWGDAIFADGFD